MQSDNSPETSRESSVSSSLQRALRQGLFLHGGSCILGLFPALVFIRRVHLFFSNRLLSLFFSFVALGYFPTVALCTSLAIGLFSFSLRQTTVIERVLNRVCDRLIAPLLEKLPSSAQNAEIRVAELDARVQAGADAVLGENSDTADPARSLSRMVLRIALFMLRKMAKSKFEQAIVSKSGGGPPVITMQAAVAALQGEFVKTVLSPFKSTVRLYFCGALVLSLVLMFVPLRLVR